MTFKVSIKLPKIELNKEGMKYAKQKAGEAVVPVVSDRVRAKWNNTGTLADEIKYVGGKVRPSSRKRKDSKKLNNFGLAKVLLHRDGGSDPFEVDKTIEEAAARGAQEALAEIAESVLVWDGFGEDVGE